MVRPRGTDKAKVIQVIETESIRGNGTDTDPVRLIKRIGILKETCWQRMMPGKKKKSSFLLRFLTFLLLILINADDIRIELFTIMTFNIPLLD